MPVADRRLDRDATTRLLGETEDLRKAEARAFSWLLGGEKGLEHAGQHIARNANSGIVDGERHIAPGKRVFGSERSVVDDGVEGLERENATGRHGVPGVDGQVQHDQLDLGWIHQGRPKVSGQRRPELYRPAERGAEEIAHPEKLAVQIDLLRLEPLLAREGQELRGQIGAPFGRAADKLDTFLVAGVAQIASQ